MHVEDAVETDWWSYEPIGGHHGGLFSILDVLHLAFSAVEHVDEY